MTDYNFPSRRRFLGGVCAAALVPGMANAQTAGPSFAEFAAYSHVLSGFDIIARPLLRNVSGLFDDLQRTALVDGSEAGEDLQKTLLKALYTGRHYDRNGEMQRFAYSDALMYAAIEHTVNVPSYCGGLPGYWAQKPNVA